MHLSQLQCDVSVKVPEVAVQLIQASSVSDSCKETSRDIVCANMLMVHAKKFSPHTDFLVRLPWERMIADIIATAGNILVSCSIVSKLV